MKKYHALLRGAVLFLICTGAGYQLGSFLGRTIKRAHAAGQPLEWWSIALVPVLLFGVLAWHEFGHVLGGWSAGFVTWLYAVGPLRLDRENGRLHARFNRDFTLWGGVAGMAPQDGVPPDLASLSSRMFRVVAGGPLASVLLALLLPLGLLIGRESTNLAFLLTVTGGTSLMIAAVTLIPHRIGGFLSDGARTLQLLRGGDSARLWCANAAVASLATTLRPRDWPPALVAGLRGQGEHHDEVTARWLLHSWHVDRKEWPEAQTALDEALAGAPKLAQAFRALIHASAAWHYALLTRGAEARSHLQLICRTGFLKPGDFAAIEAAVLAAEGRHLEALDKAALAESQLTGRSGFQAELYRELLQEIRLRSASPQLAS